MAGCSTRCITCGTLAVVALVSLLHGGLVRLPADRDVHHLRLPAVPAWDLCTCAALAGTRYDTTDLVACVMCVVYIWRGMLYTITVSGLAGSTCS